METSHLSNLFSQSQVNTVLVAWLPTKLEPFLTGIMAVDMFITTVIASAISTLAFNIYRSIRKGAPWENDKNVTVQIEYYNPGKYGGIPYVNVFYEALSWLISQQTKKLDEGSFIIRSTTNLVDNVLDDIENGKELVSILPEKEQSITVEHDGKKFHVKLRTSEQELNENIPNDNYNFNSRAPNANVKKSTPSIYLTTTKDSNTDVDGISEFLNQVLKSYLKVQKKLKVRSRYERDESYWQSTHSLSSVKGLNSVAIDESHEELLKKELDLFINDRDFYERVGMPYRRGILLYGKPGTGKTSLINAISSHLSRNIYYINLQNIFDDNELRAAFCDVPENQIIVLEDIDAQSKVVHKRKRKPFKKSKDHFSLSTFLDCLDGRILSGGNIIIMTTNHIECLDPACIRPGRMDVQLNLDYCTHYQIKKMYRSVVENPEAEFPQDILEKIPEKLLPPCEVMMTMALYRNKVDLIPQKVHELVKKYENMNPEDIAKQVEEEVYCEEKEETKSEQTDDESEEEEEEEDDKVKEFLGPFIHIRPYRGRGRGRGRGIGRCRRG